jgi:hypothetical protein
VSVHYIRKREKIMSHGKKMLLRNKTIIFIRYGVKSQTHVSQNPRFVGNVDFLYRIIPNEMPNVM